MAGQVPQSAPPGFASSFGDVMGNQAKNRADILGAELESNSANLGHILSNITKIAEVGGGALTPDRLLAAYAGSKGDIIDDQYSQGADARRAAQELANIASTNRRGTGGGGAKGDGSNLKVGQFVGTDGKIYDWGKFDEQTLASILAGENEIKVAIGGPTYEGELPVVRRDGSTGGERQTFPDGSYVEGGIAYDKDGNPL